MHLDLVKFIGIEKRIVIVRDWREEEMGSEFQLGKVF
jgi:hypothetical protein